MANISIGASGMIGTDSWTPIRLAPQPHWKTATTTPYAAATPSTLRTAAFSGTSTDRNTTISTRNNSPITAPRQHVLHDSRHQEGRPNHGAEDPRLPLLDPRGHVARQRGRAGHRGLNVR